MITGLTQRFEVPGFTLAWDGWGDPHNPPLVLIHGFGGSVHDFALEIEPLADTRRVYAIDHRGHGRSSSSFDETSYTIDHIVDDLVAWIRSEVSPDDQPFDVLGHSMGGRIAMRLALTRRDLVRSLVLLDTTAWNFGPSPGEGLDGMVSSFAALTPESAIPRSPWTPEDSLIEACTPIEWQTMLEEVGTGFDPMAAKAYGSALFDDGLQPIAHQLGDIECPATVVVGSLDQPYISHAPELAAQLGNGQVVVIDGAYHSPQLTHAHEFRHALAAHFARGVDAAG